MNRGTPSAVLETMASVNPEFLRHVARNENTPVPFLKKLSVAADIGIRWIAAGNASMPATNLRKLSRDEDSSVQ
jgi:hypothetical protein